MPRAAKVANELAMSMGRGDGEPSTNVRLSSMPGVSLGRPNFSAAPMVSSTPTWLSSSTYAVLIELVVAVSRLTVPNDELPKFCRV